LRYQLSKDKLIDQKSQIIFNSLIDCKFVFNGAAGIDIPGIILTKKDGFATAEISCYSGNIFIENPNSPQKDSSFKRLFNSKKERDKLTGGKKIYFEIYDLESLSQVMQKLPKENILKYQIGALIGVTAGDSENQLNIPLNPNSVGNYLDSITPIARKLNLENTTEFIDLEELNDSIINSSDTELEESQALRELLLKNILIRSQALHNKITSTLDQRKISRDSSEYFKLQGSKLELDYSLSK
jgi:hypothetical protein